MKKFKNNLSVKGRKNQLIDFSLQLNLLGYRSNNENDWLPNLNHIIIYGDRAEYGYHNHSGDFTTHKLPDQFNEAIQFASEKEQEIEVPVFYPNIVEQWTETFFKITWIMSEIYNSKRSVKSTEQAISSFGNEGLIALTKNLTNEFEMKNIGKDWKHSDIHYNDALAIFLGEHLK